MKRNFSELLKNAAQLTRIGHLTEATDAIKAALSGKDMPAPATGGGRDTGAVGFNTSQSNASGSTASRVTASGLSTPATSPRSPGEQDFALHRYKGTEGSISYRLFSPANEPGAALPLVVMLHGCTQDALDFSIGTEMNQMAGELGFHVLYPQQDRRRNQQGCWNWFERSHQQRGQGEPGLIAELTQAVIEMRHVDPSHVYVAGLSAGGAMAAILGQAYPDIFAAIGVHSGLAPRAAHDLTSAMRAMKFGASSAAVGRLAPAIVFHGLNDQTVSSKNAQQVILCCVGEAGVSSESLDAGVRRIYRSDGSPAITAELWLVPSLGHAWSGGSSRGSYATDTGPDASLEMVRFFLAHRLEPDQLSS